MQHLITCCSLVLLMACSAQPTENRTNYQEMDSLSLEERAQKLAQQLIITDGHVDLPYRLNKKMEDVSIRTESGDFDFVRAQKGGLNAPFMSIYVPAAYQESGGAKEFAEGMIQLVEGLAANFPDKFAIARTPEEVRSIFSKGLIAFPMGMENGAPIGEDLALIQHFHDLGIRYITLTHSKDNLICDSSYDNARTWNGLSPFGQQVIQEMNRVGIMVDISHVSDSAFYQVLELTKAPVIASHSSCRHFTPEWERNMSDDMIKKLADNGGVIQINFGSSFLDESSNASSNKIQNHLNSWEADMKDSISNQEIRAYKDKYHKEHFIYATVSRVVDHIDHVVSIAGIDYVGIGSDYDGVGDSLPTGLKDVSQYPNLILELLKRGYSEEEIEKICYKNVFRVWNKTAEVAAALQGTP